jgi:hypothetical protein
VPRFHWQLPLPSSAPPTPRTHTSDSVGSLSSLRLSVSMDVTGAEDVPVAAGAAAPADGGAGSGFAPDGLRRRAATGSGAGGGVGGEGVARLRTQGDAAAAPGGSLSRRVYQGRSAGKLERLRVARQRRGAVTGGGGGGGGDGGGGGGGDEQPTLGTVTPVHEDEGAPLEEDERALLQLLTGLRLEEFFPPLRAEALGSLRLLAGVAAADGARARALLGAAGMTRAGHQEAVLLALAEAARRGEGGAAGAQQQLLLLQTAAAPLAQPPAAAGTAAGSPPQSRLPGVRDQAIRAALARLHVTASEASVP